MRKIKNTNSRTPAARWSVTSFYCTKWRHHATHNYYVASQRIQDFLEAFFTVFEKKRTEVFSGELEIEPICVLLNIRLKLSRSWDFQQWGNVMCDQQKAQTSLRIRALRSESLLVAWIFHDSKATDWTLFGVSKLKRRLHSLVWVYTCQNAHCWKSHVATNVSSLDKPSDAKRWSRDRYPHTHL